MKSWKLEYLKGLVDSLSVNEKRYFKLMTDESKSKNYLKIFDALAKNASERELKGSLLDSKINLSYEKSYLIKLILRSLRNFNEENSLENTLHQALIDVETLLDKQMVTFCCEFIDYYMEIAKKFQLFSFQLQFLKKKRKCVMRMGNIQKQADFIEEEYEWEMDCLNKMANIAEYKRLQQKAVVLISQKGNSFMEEDKKLLKSLGEHPLMKDVSLALSVYAKMHFYEIKIWCNYYDDNYEEAYFYSSEMIKIIEDSNFIFNAFPQMYLAVYANHYSRAYKLDKYEELDGILEKIDRLASAKNTEIPRVIKHEAFSYSSERKLIFYANHDQFEKCIEQFLANKKVFATNIKNFKPAYLILQHYFAAYAYFHTGDYDKAVKNIKEVLDNFGEDIRLDFIIYTQILYIMVHYELGNFSLIPYLLKSLERLILKKKIQSEFLKVSIAFFKNIAKNAKQLDEHHELFEQYQKSLEDMNELYAEEVYYSTLGTKRWIQYNLNKK